MIEEDFLAMLSRLSSHRPTDLDAAMFAAESKASGALLSVAHVAPAPNLWGRYEESTSFIGIRETHKEHDYPQIAARLISAAVERGVAPVILSSVDHSGFSRFGLRVERLSGDTEDERLACEQQITAFWNLAIVIDAEQVASLG